MLLFLFLNLSGLFIQQGSSISQMICNRTVRIKYWNANCGNIFLWNADRREFLSLLNVSYSHLRGEDSRNPEGYTVRVLADNMLPYITSSNYSSRIGGYLGDIWYIIEEYLNFTSNVTSVFYDTGLDLITSGKADILLAAVVHADELLNIYYSQPYFYTWYQMHMMNPGATFSSMSYLKTFHKSLWFYSVALFLVLTTTVWTTVRLLKPFKIESHESIPKIFMGIISGFLNQGIDLKLSSYSARIQLFFALVFGLVLYTGMNALLVAKLTISVSEFPFKSLAEVANKRTHSLCLRTNSFVYNNFTDHSNGLLSSEWSGIINTSKCPNINNQSYLIKTICTEGVVVLENRIVLNNVLKRDIRYPLVCEIMTLPEEYFKTGNYFLMKKTFKYASEVEFVMKKMRSTGVLKRLANKWLLRDELELVVKQEFQHVTLEHTKGILYVYAFWILLSLIILLGEIICCRYNKVKMINKGRRRGTYFHKTKLLH